MAVAPRERRATRDRSDRATAVRIGARSRGHAVTSFIAFRLLQRHSAGECQSLTCPRSWAGRPLRSSTSYTASWLEWDGSSPNREPKRRSAAFATCPFFNRLVREPLLEGKQVTEGPSRAITYVQVIDAPIAMRPSPAFVTGSSLEDLRSNR